MIADAIVFTRTKHRANRLALVLERRGDLRLAKIHGNRSQSQRTAALDGFKAGKHRVLVATDIVARGIDVEELGHVINFDVPASPDAYIHRVGRTARADATGDAFTFVSPDEEADLRAIERVLGKPLLRVTLPEFDYSKRTEERLEIPQHERLAAHRASGGGRRAGTGHGAGGSRRPGGGRGAGAGHRTGGSQRPGNGRGGKHPGANQPSGSHPRSSGHGGSHGSERRSAGGGASSSQRGSGGGHGRARSRPGSDARLQAILDRHAPLEEGAGSRTAAQTGRRRRRR